MGEFSFFNKLHLTTGVRMESNDMSVNTKDLYALNNDTTSTIKKTDWLPAATVVYNILDNLNARFAYSKTLARPDFRELTRTTYYDVDGRLQVYNSGKLKQTSTDNYDVRIEWYPENGEVISLSAFYKRFRLPIEMITVDETGTGTNFTQYSVNLDNATVKGLEFNFRKGLAFIAPGSFLKDIYVNGNFSLIGGNVDYTLFRTDNKKRERTLQGLAPYTVNAGLNYQGNVFGAAVNYGRSGRVLVMSANEAYLDQYQNPRNVLDVQLSARFLKNRQLEVKFNASDLLNEDYIVYRNGTYEAGKGYVDLTGKGMDYNNGDWVMSRIKRGVNLSISVSYRL